MHKVFWEVAWKDYLYWQENDKKILRKINELLKDIERNGALQGLGKPEILSADLKGMFSRRIDLKHRLVYYTDENCIYIVGCRTHYKDK